MDVRQNTALRDGDVTQKLVQLLVVPDGELQMPGDDAGLLVVTSGIASQLKDFGRKIFEHGSQIDRRTGTDALSIVALPEKTVDTTDREGQTSLGGPTERWTSASEGKEKDQKRKREKRDKARPSCERAGQVRWMRVQEAEMRQKSQEGANSRLRVLGTAGLAAGFAASSHFERFVSW